MATEARGKLRDAVFGGSSPAEGRTLFSVQELNPHRLPRTATPSNYRLHLEPDLDAATFVGRVEITLDLGTGDGGDVAQREIVMNAAELAVNAASISIGDTDLAASFVETDEELERLRLTFDDDLPAGPAVLTLDFTGILNDKLRGFYRSTYTDDDGVSHTLATTQFESTNARRAFPCWDEPDIKATFDVTLTVASDLLAVSCQSEVSSEPLPDGRRTVTFARTPIMSTYLLAFVVGNLEATEPVTAGGVPMRIIHVPGKGHMTQFALDAGKFAMDWLTDYFAIPYPGDKCDMIAIPDFAFGAMENMGCVTYREILLLVDPDTTTQPEQQRSVDVIAHELAHMWFGNLVTMKWWNGLWLKEAFATFMEMMVTDAYRPEWQRWVDFGLSRTGAFRVDSLATTRAIEFEVNSPADAEGMYDVLTYEKGAAVVRMLQQYLGEDEFRAGVTHYLQRHSFGNTETHDLWDALEETTGQPVRRIMDSWIFQGGYPLVEASLAGSDTLTLTQQQFRFSGATDAQWAVPVVVSCGENGTRTDTRALLEGDSVPVGPDATPDWVLVNSGASGFYRVGYSPELLDGLVNNLDALEPIERYGLVDDAWARLTAGSADLAEVVSMLGRFSAETDLSVWQRILGVVGSLGHLAPDAHGDDVAAFARSLARPLFDTLGAEPVAGESDRTNELRAALLRTLGSTGRDADAIALARSIHGNPDADASLAAAALSVVASNGDATDFAEVLDRYRTADSPQKERRNLFALSMFPGTEQMETLLPMTLNGEIRSQDGAYVLATAMRNRKQGLAAWRFVAANWDALNATLPDNAIPRMLSGVSALSHPELVAEIVDFVAAHPVPQGALTVAQEIEQLHVNVDLRSRVEAQIADALAAL